MTHTLPAVITAGGAGTRFAEFTQILPKEVLPVGGRPAITWVIAECLGAGATEAIVVTRPGDTAIPALAQRLHREHGWPVTTVPEDVEPGYGNAVPLLTLRERLAEATTFLVAFGDDVLLGEPSPGHNLAAMARQVRAGADAAIAAQLVPRDRIPAVGIIDPRPDNASLVAQIRQRPPADTVGEPLAVVSRLVLRPTILDRLVPTAHARGEIDLGIAVGQLAHTGEVGLHRLTATWVTVGDARSYHAANTAFWNLHTTSPALTALPPLTSQALLTTQTGTTR
ncbi:sugar phosphate nucleotidyltransferase [Amycolatopsis sp. OK19-0408]|uniref:UTP--glucose-1-phosphate uridylyltransferase n=1 Tax=Amycolatopsis iheyensis TaxID=2945988 RepID=A0A9X2SPN1_9PSEU|nr:sugar phosphate nucleotidyltransferase [Amycolatopsis iheyensis]MCR6488351.1 sugar phosphate nucleotidyltransferase [Amycolatopsis iheyensis]